MKIRILVAPAIALALMSCAPRLAVAPIEITDQARYIADVDQCRPAAASYRPSMSAAAILVGAVGNALEVFSYWVIYPLMPVYGAASGAAKAAVAPYDVTGQIRANVFRHCMADKLARDRAAIIANPDN